MMARGERHWDPAALGVNGITPMIQQDVKAGSRATPDVGPTEIPNF